MRRTERPRTHGRAFGYDRRHDTDDSTRYASGSRGQIVCESRRPASNRVSSFLLFATAAAAPLPFGSTDHSSVALWCIVLGGAAAAASFAGLRKTEVALLAAIGLIVLAYSIVLHEQLSTTPWLPIAVPDPLWREAAAALGSSLEATVSIARHRPYFALGPPMAALLALASSLVVCADRDRARHLLRVIAWSGVAYAIFGFLSLVVDPN